MEGGVVGVVVEHSRTQGNMTLLVMYNSKREKEIPKRDEVLLGDEDVGALEADDIRRKVDFTCGALRDGGSSPPTDDIDIDDIEFKRPPDCGT